MRQMGAGDRPAPSNYDIFTARFRYGDECVRDTPQERGIGNEGLLSHLVQTGGAPS